MQLLDCKGDLENTWNRLVKIETGLGKAVNYAFSPKFGFLTSDPTQCGTALIVTIYLHLPALFQTAAIDEALETLADESITVSGIQGDPEEIIGDILAIRNNFTLGITEENIIASLRSFGTKLQVEESTKKKHIKNANSADIKDKVSRAYGILIHSYQIEAVEALNAISLLKLGTEMGWLSGMSIAQFNELFFNCRRAHLLCKLDEKIKQEEIGHKRAEFIHKTLKNVTLNI